MMVKIFAYTIIEEVDFDDIIQYLAENEINDVFQYHEENEPNLVMKLLYEQWRGFAYYYGDKIGIPDKKIDEFADIVAIFMATDIHYELYDLAYTYGKFIVDLVKIYDKFQSLDGISDETKAKLMFEHLVNIYLND